MSDTNFKITKQVTTRIEETDPNIYIERFNEALKGNNKEQALIDINKALEYSKSKKQRKECIFAKIKILYLMELQDDIIKLIDDELDFIFSNSKGHEMVNLFCQNVIDKEYKEYLLKKLKSSYGNLYKWLFDINKEDKEFVYNYLSKNMINLIDSKKLKIDQVLDIIIKNTNNKYKKLYLFNKLIDNEHKEYNSIEKISKLSPSDVCRCINDNLEKLLEIYEVQYLLNVLNNTKTNSQSKIDTLEKLYSKELYNLDILKSIYRLNKEKSEFYLKRDYKKILSKYGEDKYIAILKDMNLNDLLFEYINTDTDYLLKLKGESYLIKILRTINIDRESKLRFLEKIYNKSSYNLDVIEEIYKLDKEKAEFYLRRDAEKILNKYREDKYIALLKEMNLNDLIFEYINTNIDYLIKSKGKIYLMKELRILSIDRESKLKILDKIYNKSSYNLDVIEEIYKLDKEKVEFYLRRDAEKILNKYGEDKYIGILKKMNLNDLLFEYISVNMDDLIGLKGMSYLINTLSSINIDKKNKLEFLDNVYDKSTYNLDVIDEIYKLNKEKAEFYLTRDAEKILNKYGEDKYISILKKLNSNKLLFKYINIHIDKLIKIKGIDYLLEMLRILHLDKRNELEFLEKLYKKDLYNLNIIKEIYKLDIEKSKLYLKRDSENILNKYGEDIYIALLKEMEFYELLYNYLNENINELVKSKGSNYLLKMVTSINFNKKYKLQFMENIYKRDLYNLSIIKEIYNLDVKRAEFYLRKDCFYISAKYGENKYISILNKMKLNNLIFEYINKNFEKIIKNNNLDYLLDILKSINIEKEKKLKFLENVYNKNLYQLKILEQIFVIDKKRGYFYLDRDYLDIIDENGIKNFIYAVNNFNLNHNIKKQYIDDWIVESKYDFNIIDEIITYYSTISPKEALDYTEKLIIELEDKKYKNMSLIYLKKGKLLYMNIHDYNMAKEALEKAYKISKYEEISLKQKAQILYNLSIIYCKLENSKFIKYYKAEKLYRESLKYDLSLKEPKELSAYSKYYEIKELCNNEEKIKSIFSSKIGNTNIKLKYIFAGFIIIILLFSFVSNKFGENATNQNGDYKNSVAYKDNKDENNKDIQNDVKSDEYIISNSSDSYLDKSELSQYSKEELSYIRNEIYARHGYIFKDDKYRPYFENKSWYKPDTSFKGQWELFNDYEKSNLQLIKSLEN